MGIAYGFAWIHVTHPVFKMSTSIFSKETIANDFIAQKGKALRVRTGREAEKTWGDGGIVWSGGLGTQWGPAVKIGKQWFFRLLHLLQRSHGP